MKLKIKVDVPSYKRAWGVDTLRFVPSARIWVCKSEEKEYQEQNPNAEIIGVKKGIQGSKARILNHILDREFSDGVDAVCIMDDDIQYIGYYQDLQHHVMRSQDFLPWLEKYTRFAMEWDVRMWGVNLNVDKQYYREFTPFCTTSPVGGPFAVHLPHELRYDERFPTKDDYDMALQQLNRYRKVLRLNKFHYVVKQGGSGSGQKGGCSVGRNVKNEIAQNEGLIKKWGPKIVKFDYHSRSHTSKKESRFDINPIVKVPIRGV